ncbi:arsenosugar biosynthesis radical SAM (seleno)protein ArsS [Sessilibacter sp. MAH4]
MSVIFDRLSFVKPINSAYKEPEGIMHATLPLLEVTDFPEINRAELTTLQVNIGYLCNQRCLHCHVNASPDRKEMMSEELIQLIPEVIKARGINTLDLTGGAPEMHQQFRELVAKVRAMGVRVIDRCNLTILTEPGYEGTAEFLAEHKVDIVASLPCYSQDNVDSQRGDGVFDRSILGLQMLNKLGYGLPDSELSLNLVYNPLGATLPPNQEALEQEYKKHLFDNFGIHFNQLFALANMPIKRFGSTLISKGKFADYMNLLKTNANFGNLDHVMCKSLVSVDWLGNLYDCDFNQQLEMPVVIDSNGAHAQLKDLLENNLQGCAIKVADHCYGCIAGSGSSCGGSLS